MTSRYEKYRFHDGKTDLDADTFNAVFGDLDMRIVQMEQFKNEYDSESAAAVELGLARIDAVILPMIEQLNLTIAQAQSELEYLVEQTSDQMEQELADAQAQLNAMLSQAQAMVDQIAREIENIITRNTLEERLKFSTRPAVMEISYDESGRVETISETVRTLRTLADEEVTRGSGPSDDLENTPVESISRVYQGETEYIKDTDWKQTGDAVEWLDGGSSPGEGEAYSVDYMYTLSSTRETGITYSESGLVASVEISIDGAVRTETYTYDGEGNVTGMSAFEGEV